MDSKRKAKRRPSPDTRCNWPLSTLRIAHLHNARCTTRPELPLLLLFTKVCRHPSSYLGTLYSMHDVFPGTNFCPLLASSASSQPSLPVCQCPSAPVQTVDRLFHILLGEAQTVSIAESRPPEQTGDKNILSSSRPRRINDIQANQAKQQHRRPVPPQVRLGCPPSAFQGPGSQARRLVAPRRANHMFSIECSNAEPFFFFFPFLFFLATILRRCNSQDAEPCVFLSQTHPRLS